MKWINLIIRGELVIGFWFLIGTMHFVAVARQSIRFEFEFDISIRMYSAFIIHYSLWSVLSLTTLCLLKVYGDKSRGFYLFLFIALMSAWLPLNGIFDNIVSHVILSNELSPFEHITKNIPPLQWFINTVIFCLNFGFCSTVSYIKRLETVTNEALLLQKQHSELELKNSEFQMQALQAQLNPHFLFNSLNTISSFGRRQDGEKVVKTTSKLADLLRYAVDATKTQQITIGDELRFTESYIDMQRIRFGNKYRYNIYDKLIDRSLYCPPFCIQPLVENAFHHSKATAELPTVIDILLTQDESHVYIEVRNTNTNSNQHKGLGTALANLQQRLELLYGSAATLILKATSGKFLSKLTIPVKTP